MSTVVMTGVKELDMKLGRLERNLQRKIVRKASREAAKPVQRAAKQYAPVDEGTLQQGIKVRALRRSRGRIGAQVTLDQKGMKATLGEDIFYGGFQEWGTKYITGQLFMTNAARSKKQTVVIVFRGHVRRGIMAEVR